MDTSDLRNMVMAFRVTELQTLLNYAGKNRSGRKNELQQRALDLIRGKPGQIAAKVRELYRTIQMQTMSQPQPASAGIPNPNSTFSTGTVNRYTISGLNSSAPDRVLQGRNPFAQYNGAQPKVPGLSFGGPVCPNVKLKRLPFYDIIHDIIKPTNLQPQSSARVQETAIEFSLTADQSALVASSKEFTQTPNGDQKIQYGAQLQLRFCVSDTSSDQEDCFPPSMSVKLNGKIIPLPHPIPSNRPGVEPKRPSRPLNVTNYAKLSPVGQNKITVIWSPDGNKTYAISLYLVKKLCSSDLLSRLKQKGVRPSEFTKRMIRDIVQKDEADCQIATTSFKVSIACPLGKCRMTLPCRASTCAHLQCFDANLYLQMNEKKPSWNCPVCDKATLFDNLNIDGYFQDVLKEMKDSPPCDGNDIEILPDGTWLPIKVKRNEDDSPPVKRIRKESPNLNQTICIDDDLIIEDVPPPTKRKNETITLDAADIDSDSPLEEVTKASISSSSSSKPKPSKQVVCIDLTIEDSDEEEPEAETQPEEPEPSTPSPGPTPTRTLRPRGGKATYVDETSSSSSTTNDGSIKADPSSDHAPASPACITLDSPCSSPELRREEPPSSSRDGLSNSSGPNFSNYGSYADSSGGVLGGAANFSSSTVAYNTRQAALASSASVVNTASYSSIANDTASLLASSAYSAQPSQGYVPYSSNWNSQTPQGNYEGGSNFGTIDYQSLDYFSQPSYNTRSGGTGGYNWPT